ncbi:MAG: hypothetical protein KAI27_05595 [Rhodospirillaceae bacterium]|nr:hypothetical protein [Rhodospirillaceae bacterium]
MSIFLITFGMFLLVMMGLAVGVLAGRGPLKGSCGGDTMVRNCPVCKGDDT